MSSIGRGCPGRWQSHYPWRYLTEVQMWCLGTQFSGGPGSAGLKVGFDDLTDLFSSMILWLYHAAYGQSQRKVCLRRICYFVSKPGSLVPFYSTFLFLKDRPNSWKLSWSKVIDVKKPRSFAMACWMRMEENCLYSAVLCFSRLALSQRSRKRRKMNKWKGIMFIFWQNHNVLLLALAAKTHCCIFKTDSLFSQRRQANYSALARGNSHMQTIM